MTRSRPFGGRPASPHLERAEGLRETVDPSIRGEVDEATARLRRAIELGLRPKGALQGETEEILFRGECLSDMPLGLQTWLEKTGQLQRR